MKAQWQQWDPQRQLLVVGSGLVLAALVWGFGVAWPLRQYRQQAQQALLTSQQQQATLQALVQQYSQQGQSTQAGQGTAVDVLSLVNLTLQAQGLQAARMQQLQSGEVQLRLENVPYAAVIAWLAAVEQAGSVALNRVSLTAGLNATTTVVVTAQALLREEPAAR
jgi:general secretion pathway protein M